MKLPKIFYFKKFTKISGRLLPITFNKKFPIKVKRIFFIYGKKKYKRGDHAHKKCNQIIIPIKGLAKIEIITKKRKKIIFSLSRKNRKYLFVPKFHWIKIKFNEKKASLLTLCDFKYDKKEYIQDFNKF